VKEAKPRAGCWHLLGREKQESAILPVRKAALDPRQRFEL
jgi:hypothetical protein